MYLLVKTTNQSILAGLLFALLGFSTVLAQSVPELGSPTSLSGTDTTARFFAGARIRGSSSSREAALQIYQDSISTPIIQGRCIVCHVAEGVASAAALIYRNPGIDSVLHNFSVIEEFIGTRSDARDYILSKVSGNDGHGGGVQLAEGSADYNSLASFLDALTADGGSGAFTHSFDYTDSLELRLQVSPEPAHVGSAGQIYVLAIAGGVFYTQISDGSWVEFDGTIEGLGGAAALAALQSSNSLTVTNLTSLFTNTGVTIENGTVSYSIYLAYDSVESPGQVYFSGSPLQLGITYADLQRESPLPLLPVATSLSGAATSARFYGGASVRDSGSFSSLLNSSDDLSVQVELIPQIEHLGNSGNSYVLASVGGVFFALLDTGEWIPFDGTLEGLGGIANHSSLEAYHLFSIDSVVNLYTRVGVSIQNNAVSVAVFVAYDSAGAPGELFFSASPLQFTLKVPVSSDQIFSIFESSISSQLVQARCITCHVEGGIARDAGLVFQRSAPASTLNNFNVFAAFLTSRDDARDYILTKASGGDNHTGGVQLPVNGTDYNNMATFLDALLSGGTGNVINASEQFFQNVVLQSNVKTLRRAAIMLAGRAPTAAEIAAVENGDDATLRTTLRNLMTGEGFHEFLVNGANDRLLVRGTNDQTFLDGGGLFYKFLNRRVELSLADRAKGLTWSFDQALLTNATDRGLKDSPLELIAYVVENERPYSEILTADYMMLNPMANFSVDGTAMFDNSDNQSEFQPGRMDRYYSNSESTVDEFVDEIQDTRILDPGNVYVDFPHAGILNTQSFLFRYPTTATNRNRARARWTFLHFLDIDIEKSAQRTTDPIALADTNNPTMNNPNCTVCHSTMDPVAGSFQNYAEEGYYRNNWNGTDSLDDFYKYPDNGTTLYQEGDTWYRDMRIPGIFDLTAPDADNSLQWLAQQMVQEPGFARAAVKFWWPSVIGQIPLRLPEVEEDATYQAQLLAYDAQTATIQALADQLSVNAMNLKDMLVEMLMSPWFRAASADEASLSATQKTAHEIAIIGNETLLTPERLMRKTRALTGFGWNNQYRYDSDRINSGLGNEYNLYYGGIDSAAVTKRSTEMTPLMSTVPATHALESACPIVLKDFMYEDGQRRLFNNISYLTTPVTEGVQPVSIPTQETLQYTQHAVTVQLSPGSKLGTVSLANGFCDYDEVSNTCLTDTVLRFSSLEIRQSGSSSGAVLRPANVNNGIDQSCAWINGQDVQMGGSCTVEVPFSADTAGEYTVIATVAAVRTGPEHSSGALMDIAVGVNSAESVLESTANGAAAIRQKMVDLYTTLLGRSVSSSSPEIDLAYQLFAETWQEKLVSDTQSIMLWDQLEQCAWWSDSFFLDDTPYAGAIFTTRTENNGYPSTEFTEEAQQYIQSKAGDPLHIKSTWVSVITYFLTHYNYLYE